jgi:hypothetical protein
MVEKLKVGQFPIKLKTNSNLFVQHQQSMPQRVETAEGALAETGFLALTKNGPINLFSVCQYFGVAKLLKIKQIAYIDEGDNLQVHELTKMAPIELQNPAYASPASVEYPVHVGFTTKLCELRWGFVVKLNQKTGQCLIETDKDSPIVGIKVELV